MKAIIMAGGKGTRLRPLTNNIPKPMVPIIDKPVMEFIINLLRDYNIKDIAVTLGYKPECIIDYFGNGKRFGVNLKYFIEEIPLGTAGSVKNALGFIGKDKDVIIMSGDAYTDINLETLLNFHYNNNADITIAAIKTDDARGLGLIDMDNSGKILRFIEKPLNKIAGVVNTGIYVMKRKSIESIPEGFYDFGKNLFPSMTSGLYACISNCYWSDIGTLGSYYLTNHYVVSHSPEYQYN